MGEPHHLHRSGHAGPAAAVGRGVMACVAKPLRFAVGDSVAARRGEDLYVPGKVIAQWDELNAYRIRLGSGEECWAPIDEDVFVKKHNASSKSFKEGNKK